MSKAKIPLKGGLRDPLFLWRVAQTLAELVFPLLISSCGYTKSWFELAKRYSCFLA